jgi:hypothetical protein
VTPLAALPALRVLSLSGTSVRDVSALRHLEIDIIGGPSVKATGRIGSAVRRLFRRDSDQS